MVDLDTRVEQERDVRVQLRTKLDELRDKGDQDDKVAAHKSIDFRFVTDFVIVLPILFVSQGESSDGRGDLGS